MPGDREYDENDFDQLFRAADKDGNEKIDKNEMFVFIRAILRNK